MNAVIVGVEHRRGSLWGMPTVISPIVVFTMAHLIRSRQWGLLIGELVTLAFASAGIVYLWTRADLGQARTGARMRVNGSRVQSER